MLNHRSSVVDRLAVTITPGRVRADGMVANTRCPPPNVDLQAAVARAEDCGPFRRSRGSGRCSRLAVRAIMFIRGDQCA